MAEEDLYTLLNKLNGIYIHGDSETTLTDPKYQLTLTTILLYVKSKVRVDGINFPVFFMGFSLNNLLKNILMTDKSILTPMKDMAHSNLNLRVIEAPSKTYILDGLSDFA